MKKKVKGRTLSRPKDQRDAMLKTMLVSLIRYGRITTTVPKAKTLRPFAERMITHAKGAVLLPEKNVAKRRLLASSLPVLAVHRLLKIAALMQQRKGGYTRIVKLGMRKSDASPMAMIEWVAQLPPDPKVVMSEKSTAKKAKKEVKKTAPAVVPDAKEEVAK